MTATRDIGDLTTDDDGERSGADFVATTRESVKALWALNGGTLSNVSGTNTITADILVSDGFDALTNGLRVDFTPVNTNTGAVEINVGDKGLKDLKSASGTALTAGDLVAGTHVEIIFNSDDDYWWLNGSSGSTNVTVEGGLQVKRSEVTRLLSEQGPFTAETSLLSRSFQCTYTNSIVAITGSISRITGTGTSDNTGADIKLYVDNVLTETITAPCITDSYSDTSIYFTCLPADTDAHTYEIRVECDIETTYPISSNWFYISENRPN
jgi:hypothetical protein